MTSCLERGFQGSYRCAGDRLWSTGLPELSRGAARAPGLIHWPTEVCFPETHGNLASLAYMEHWAKATGSPFSESKIAKTVKPQYHQLYHPELFSTSIPKWWCCESAALNVPANLENSAVATGLEKVSFHSKSKERQCQRMLKLLHNCTHLTH